MSAARAAGLSISGWAVRTIYKRDAMLVRIETEDGTVGYAPGAASEENAQKIEKEIAPVLHW